MKHADPKDLQTTERPVEKLLALADLIEANGHKFDMMQFQHGCGTPACVCGWWNSMQGRAWLGDFESARKEMGLARKMLQGRRFRRDVERLPDLFSHYVAHEALGRYPSAQDAAKVVRHFATTGKEDWSVAR